MRFSSVGLVCTLFVYSCDAFAVIPRTINTLKRPESLQCSLGTSTTLRASTLSGRGRTTSSTRHRRRAKTLADRSQQEAIDLVQDIIKAALDAGPRAGPARTLQAYKAITTTTREFLPKLLGLSAAGTASASDFSFPAVLRTLFERMGATYIKLGQFIASSPTLFPKEYVLEFQKCLDKTEPLPWSTIRKVIEDELGPISRSFDYVDETPLASASIAQVHRARLKGSGEEVVIKVQKPGIDESLKADLGFLFVTARVLEFLQPDWERTSLSAVAGDLRASMLEELDFEKEATNTIEFRRFLQDNQLLRQATAPLVYQRLSTKKVLTLEYLPGTSLLDDETVKKVTRNPEKGTETIITALNVWSMSLQDMPWFHADVHAGNLLLLEDGRVGFIDFGIVGRISDKVFQAVNELSVAVAVGDSMAMATALYNMGAADEEVDIPSFARDIERVLDRLNNVQPDVTVTAMADGNYEGRIDINESEITDLLLEFVDVAENNGLKLPREFGLLVKQSLYFDRYLKILAPNVDVMNDSRVMVGGKYEAGRGPNGDMGQDVIDV